MSTDASTNSAQDSGEFSIELPEQNDVNAGVQYALSIARDSLEEKRCDPKLWGYADRDSLVHELVHIFSPRAAQLLTQGKPTEEVSRTLKEEIGKRLDVVQSAYLSIRAAVSIVRNRTNAILSVAPSGNGAISINGTPEHVIARCVSLLHDSVIGRVLHGGILDLNMILSSVVSEDRIQKFD